MNLIDLFDHSLVGRASREAIQFDDRAGNVRSLTFGEVEARSNQLANLLRRKGVGQGDRIGVFLANCIEFVDLFLATIKLGAIFVPMNVLYRERELGHIIGDSEPVAIVTGGDLKGYLPEAREIWDIDELSLGALRESAVRPAGAIEGDSPALIVYTSGTTGRSKGAVLTHNNLLANTVNLLACWEFSSEDRYLAVLPLFHVHGLGNGIHLWLASGCRMRLVERFEIGRAPDLFRTFKPTVLFGVPTIYLRLLELPADLAREAGEEMRLFVSGSAPLPALVMEDFRAMYGRAILERYGMSETMMNIGNPYFGERRPGSVGKPFPGISVRIEDAAGNEVPDGQVGELLVRGPNVCAGYWNRPDATEEAFRDGWFRTGDLCERSSDGYYTLCGRRSDLIISGGFNIYPREIEELIMEFPGVREVSVCGAPDTRRGEVPIAYVVADEDFNAEVAEARLRRLLASFKIPRAFIKVDRLPRTALGKVQKHFLPEWKSE